MKEKLLRRFKRRTLPWVIAKLLKAGCKILFMTCRISVEGIENFITCASERSCILMFWHNRLIAVAEVLENYAPNFIYVAFVSKSRDGEIVANFTKSYRAGRTIRVPHNRREGALKEMVSHLKLTSDIIMITPDGPKGPPGEVKPGVLFAAQESGAPIIPFSWSAARFWTLPTWDGLMIPKPFTRIKVKFGSPISPDTDAHTDHLKEALYNVSR